jgi:hypothetical protein
MYLHRYTRWLIALMLAMAACAPATLDRDDTPLPPTQTPATDPSPGPHSGQGPLVDQAIADLTARLSVPASEIEVVSEESVVWPDGSLGCPQPGVAYIQILVEGSRIVLKHRDETYNYHAGPSSVVYCEQALLTPQPVRQITAAPMPTVVIEQGGNVKPTIDPSSGLQPLVDQAIADLVDRMSVDPAEVEVAAAESVVWPDTSLGCPQPGMQYLQLLTDGFRIELRVKDRVYAYHGGRGRGPFLCENPA